MPQRFALVSSGLALVCVTATVLAGPIWDCVDPQEPGGTPASAQTVTGTGPLAGIRCTLTGLSATQFDGPIGDYQDMYLVRITDPEDFFFQTVDPLTGNAFNTQIWLFDLDGRGVLANSLNLDDPPFSAMGSTANDGSGAALVDPGLYYLAVSGGDPGTAGRFPIDADGDPIFNFDPLQPELVYGPATSNPIAGWKGIGELGDYEAELIGAAFVPDIPTMSQWGAIILALLLLTVAALIIRQHHQNRYAAISG